MEFFDLCLYFDLCASTRGFDLFGLCSRFEYAEDIPESFIEEDFSRSDIKEE